MAKQRVKHFEAGGAAYGDVTLDDGTTVNTDDIGPGDPGWGGDIGTDTGGDTDNGISDPGDAEFPSVVDPLTLTPAQQTAQDEGVRKWLVDNGMSASDAATATGTAGFIDKLLSKYSDGKGGVNWLNVAKTLIPAAGGIMALNSNNSTNASADRGYQKGIPSLTLNRTKNAIPTDRRPGAGGVAYFGPATYNGQRNMGAGPGGGSAGSTTTPPVGGTTGSSSSSGTGSGGISSLPAAGSSSSSSRNYGGSGGGTDTPINAGWTTEFAAKNAAGWDAKTGGSNGMPDGTLKTRGGQTVTHQQLMDFVATNPSDNQVLAQAQKWGMSMGDVATAMNNVGLLYNNGRPNDSQMNDAANGSIYNRLIGDVSYGKTPYSTADEGISYSPNNVIHGGATYNTTTTAPISYVGGSGIYLPNGQEIGKQQIADFFKTNPDGKTIQEYATKIGLNQDQVANAYAQYKGQVWVPSTTDTYASGTVGGSRGGVSNGDGSNYQTPGSGAYGTVNAGRGWGGNNWNENDGYSGYGTGATGGGTGKDFAPGGPSAQAIRDYFTAHKGDANAMDEFKTAIKQSSITPEQLMAAGIPPQWIANVTGMNVGALRPGTDPNTFGLNNSINYGNTPGGGSYTATPAAAVQPVGIDAIKAYYEQHKADPNAQAEFASAIKQYGITPQQLQSAGFNNTAGNYGYATPDAAAATQPTAQAPAAPTDWNRYMQLNPDLGAAGITTAAQAQQHWDQFGKNENRQYAKGGGIAGLPGAAPSQGRFLRGPGDGVSDSIPARIDGKKPAAIADGEFIIPARAVSEIGNGSSEAGSRKLYAMLDRIEKTRHRNKNTAKDTRADKHLPA